MENSNRHTLNIIVGEHYLYRSEECVIINISDNRVQFRSLTQRKKIFFQSYKTLIIEHRHGNFQKTQESPFNGEATKIIGDLTEKQRSKLNRRLRYIMEVEACSDGRLPVERTKKLIDKVSSEIGDHNPPSYITLYNWRRLYLRSGRNVLSLLPKHIKEIRKRKERQTIVVQEIIDYHVYMLYYRSTPCTIKAVVEAIQYAIEDTNSKRPISDQLHIPSTSTLRRIINELDRYETDKYQLGTSAALRMQKWSRKQGKIHRVLQRVECDTHTIDVFVVDETGRVLGKPFITIILDICSRMVIGWDISLNPPSLEKTIRALKRSISSNYQRNGLAMLYIMDNGSEFIANELKDRLTLLGASVTYCEPHEPDQKPFVERWFKTLTLDLTHHIEGTTFSGIQERGEYDSEGQARFSLTEISVSIEDWINNIYHKSRHAELGTSPEAAWDEHLSSDFPPRKFSSFDLQRIFMRRIYATPNNGRIGFSYLQWTGPAVAYLSTLTPRKTKTAPTKPRKQKLILHYDPSELGIAWVSHPDAPDTIFSIKATDPDYQNGLTLDMHNLIRADINNQKKEFDSRIARNNRVRLNMYLAQAKGKKARALREHLYKSHQPPPTTIARPSLEKLKSLEQIPIDPSIYLIDSEVPSLAEVVEVNHEPHT